MKRRHLAALLMLAGMTTLHAQQVSERDMIIYTPTEMPQAEGSTLHELMQRLPGVSLTSDGGITVSDRRVTSFNVNGEDITMSDFSTMLYTLPVHMVREIKARMGKPITIVHREHMETDREGVALLVELKDEYRKDTHLTISGGAGTDNLWDTSLFGITRQGKTQAILFGRANNTFDAAGQNYATEWAPHNLPHGTHTTRQLGLTLSTRLKDNVMLMNSDVYTSLSGLSEMHSQQQMYTAGGTMNVHRLNTVSNSNKQFRHGTAVLGLYKTGKFLNDFSFSYTDKDGTQTSNDSTETVGGDTNTSLTETTNGQRVFQFHDYFTADKDFSTLYKLQVVADALFKRTVHDDEASTVSHYMGKGRMGYSTDRCNGSRTYTYMLEGRNIFHITRSLDARLNLSYAQTWEGRTQDYDYMMPFATPSGEAVDGYVLLQEALQGSTFNFSRHTRTYGTEAQIYYSHHNHLLSLSLRYEHLSHRLRYNSPLTDTLATRRYNVPTPTVNYERRWKSGVFYARYGLQTVTPEMLNLLDLYTCVSANKVRQGNADLRRSLSHNIDLSLRMQPRDANLRWWTKLTMQWQRHTLDEQLRYLQYNDLYVTTLAEVDRRFDARLSGGVMGSLGKDSPWHYAARVAMQVTRDADHSVATATTESQLCRYTRLQPLARLRMTYRPSSSFSVDGLVRFSGHFTRDSQLMSRNINVNTWRYGVQTTYKVPVADITLTSDLSLYTNGGSVSSHMNTNDWVWNASLSRSFFHRRLSVRAALYDILHQIQSRSYEYSAQGFTEVSYNTLPSYGMLSVSLNL